MCALIYHLGFWTLEGAKTNCPCTQFYEHSNLQIPLKINKDNKKMLLRLKIKLLAKPLCLKVICFI
jgi:hypothetical protein